MAGPPRCARCRTPGTWLCRRCADAMPAAGPRPPTPPLCGVIAALEYSGTARDLVLALKLRGRRGAAEPLSDALARCVARNGLSGDVITWVPGRRRDARARGYDHAGELARGLAARLGLPASQLLIRTGARPDQAGLPAARRRHNLEGAFRARPGEGRRVVLVDDLVTTGATARACAGALLAAGAGGVELAAACSVAREIRGAAD